MAISSLPVSHWGARQVIREDLPLEGFRGILIMDFEATCAKDVKPKNSEIIEFPAVLLNGRTFEVVDEFREFVRPTEKILPNLREGELTAFCTELTSITQAQVDGAQRLPTVLRNFNTWLATHNLEANAVLPVTCGDWDLKTMLPVECERKRLYVPEALLRWCNIKQLFEHATKQNASGMAGMLWALGLRLEGHHHSGIDDCRNIARIFQRLLARYGPPSAPPMPEQPVPKPVRPQWSEHEKNFLKHVKVVRDILKLEEQQASGQTLAQNQVLKLRRKSAALREVRKMLESIAMDSDLRQKNEDVIRSACSEGDAESSDTFVVVGHIDSAASSNIPVYAHAEADPEPHNDSGLTDPEVAADDVPSCEAAEPEEFKRRPRPPGGRSGRARRRDAKQ
jgi:inhibitor of KinA sporulation pathway (predicted exonuclease)